MSDDTDQQPSGPWGRIGGWVREEKFWRDVGTRVLAGVITAAIVYAGALVLGYLHTPEVGAGLLLVLGIVACGILLTGIVALLRTVPARARAGRAVVGRIVVSAVLLIVAVALATGVAIDLIGR